MLHSIITNTADIIVLVLFFGASIFIHELGHFLVALKLGLVIDTFSIGFGPALWKKEVNGIVFKISAIPLGGYVALPQLDPSGMSTVQGVSEDGKEVTHRELPEISPIKKIAVAAAGAAGNIVLAVIFACIIWLSPAAITYKGAAIVNSVEKGSPAYVAGIRANDEITKIDGKPVGTWNDVNVELLLASGNDHVTLQLKRDKKEKEISAPLTMNKGAKIPSIKGIVRQSTPCILKDITPESPAAKAGLKDNDIVVSFDGTKISGANEFFGILTDSVDKKVPIIVDRQGKSIATTITPKYEKIKTERALIGVILRDRLLFDILPASPAAAAGLQKGDVIKSFAGQKITEDVQFINLVAQNDNKSVPMIVERNGKDVALSVKPSHYSKQASIGAKPIDLIFPWMQEKKPLAQLRADASGIVRLLKALVTPKESKQAASGLGGPVMIIAALWLAIKISLFNAIGFIRFLNVNLAILNMLPIPVLYGGHIMFSLWELITRRKVHAKVVNVLVNVFAVLLIGVFIILTFRDIPTVKRMFGKGHTVISTNQVEKVATTNALPTNIVEKTEAYTE